MQNFYRLINHIINVVMAISLGIIVILVFSNVVLRYIFDSGIMWAQELSRYLFVWLIFLGAIKALKSNEHLSVTMVVRRLPQGLKKIATLLNYLLMLVILYLVLDGSWKMFLLNMNTKSPATGLPLSTLYVMGLLVGISMGAILLINIFKLLTNKVKVDELIENHKSEDREI